MNFVLEDKRFKVFVVSMCGLFMLMGKACKRSITACFHIGVLELV